MAKLSAQQVRRISILVCVAVSGLLIAHSINAFIADALYLIPEDSARSGDTGPARPVSFAPTRYADDIRSSGLFLLPATPQETRSQGEPAGTAVRASLGAAAQIRLIGIVMGDKSSKNRLQKNKPCIVCTNRFPVWERSPTFNAMEC